MPPFDYAVFLVSRKDYSRRELFTKISNKHSKKVAEEILNRLEELNLLANEQQLTERLSQSLLSKGKGPKYISNYLFKRGLPKATIRSEDEYRSALIALNSKYSVTPLEEVDTNKIYRFLLSRGFTPQSIERVLNEKL